MSEPTAENTASLTVPTIIPNTSIILMSVTADTYDEAADAAWMLWSDPAVREWCWAS